MWCRFTILFLFLIAIRQILADKALKSQPNGRADAVDSGFTITLQDDAFAMRVELNFTGSDFIVMKYLDTSKPGDHELYLNGIKCRDSCSGIRAQDFQTLQLEHPYFDVMLFYRDGDQYIFKMEDCTQEIKPYEAVFYTRYFSGLIKPVAVCVSGSENPECRGPREARATCDLPPLEPDTSDANDYTICIDSPSPSHSMNQMILKLANDWSYALLNSQDGSYPLVADGQPSCDPFCTAELKFEEKITFSFAEQIPFRLLYDQQAEDWRWIMESETEPRAIKNCIIWLNCYENQLYLMIEICPKHYNVTDCHYQDYSCEAMNTTMSTSSLTTTIITSTSIATTSTASTRIMTDATTTNLETVTSRIASDATEETNVPGNISTSSTASSALTDETTTSVTSLSATTSDVDSSTTTPSSPVTVTRAQTSLQTVASTTTPPETICMNCGLTLKNLSDIPMTYDNMGPILQLALTYTENGENLVSDDFNSVADILQSCTNFPYLHAQIPILALRNVDGMLDARDEEFSENLETMGKDKNAAARVLTSIHKIAVLSQQELAYVSGNNLGMATKFVAENGCNSLGITTQDQKFAAGGNVGERRGEASIILPASFVCNSGGTHAVVTIFKNRKFFAGQQYNTIRQRFDESPPSRGDDDDDDHGNINVQQIFRPLPAPNPCSRHLFMQDTGGVFTGTLLDASDSNNITFITRTPDAVDSKVTAKIVIDTSKFIRPLHGNYEVSWWDKEALKWAEENRCHVSMDRNRLLTAECEHLTDFTLLIDGRVNDPLVCDVILIVLGSVINVASILCLFAMLVVSGLAYSPSLRRYHWVRKLTGSKPQRRNLLQLLYILTLCLFYFVFTLFSNKKVSGSLCEEFAAISYMLFISCIILTIFQSLRTVELFYSQRELPRVILSNVNRISVVFVIGFGCPLILSVLLYFLTYFFRRQDDFCWVRHDVIVFAIVVPLSFLLFNAVICTILVAKKLFYRGTSSSRIVLTREHIRQRVVTLALMQLTLGMPWILQYLAVFSPDITVYHYLFTLVNGSQGVMIFSLWLFRRWRLNVTARRHKRFQEPTSKTYTTDDNDASREESE